MSEQEDVKVMETDCSLMPLMSPLNYLEFSNYSCLLPSSPQHSSGSELSLWDFSDCINGNSSQVPHGCDSFVLECRGYSHRNMKLKRGMTKAKVFESLVSSISNLISFMIDSTRTSKLLEETSRPHFPIFRYSGGRGLDVVELSSTSEKLSYAPEIENNSEALKVGDVSHSSNPDVVSKSLMNLRELEEGSYGSDEDALDQTWGPSDHGHAANIILTVGTAFSDIDHLSKRPRVFDDKLASRIESIPTYRTNNSKLGPEALQNEEEREKIDSVEQQSAEGFGNDKLASRTEFPTHRTNNSMLGVEALQDEEEMEITDSVEPQSVLKFDPVYDRRKINEHRGKNLETILRKSSDKIVLEDIKQHFRLPLRDAAERLGISRSTLKRLCRKHDISRWPSQKRKRDNGEQNIELERKSVREAKSALAHASQTCGLLAGSVDKPTPNSQNWYLNKDRQQMKPHIRSPEAPPSMQHENARGGNTIGNIYTVEKTRNLHAPTAKKRVLELINTIPLGSHQPGNKMVANFPSTDPMMQVAQMQDTRKITIRATYMDDVIKFPLSSSSGIGELQKEVLKRLNLRLGNFSIKYLDIDQDWVLIACDEDLQACLSTGTSVIQMSIQSK